MALRVLLLLVRLGTQPGFEGEGQVTAYRLGTYRDQLLMLGTTVLTTAVNHQVLAFRAGNTGTAGGYGYGDSDEHQWSKWYKCTAATTASLFYWARVSSYPSALERSSWH